MKAPVKQVVAVVTREITVRSAENILDFIETDQTAPAGRWRLRLDGDKIYFDRATAADWATFETWLTYDKANEKLTLGKKLDAGALKIENLGAPDSDDDVPRRDTIDSKIATHNALDTGVHGVGASTVCSETEAATLADGLIAIHAGLPKVHQDAAALAAALIATHAGLPTVHQDAAALAAALIATHAGLPTVHQDAPALIATHAGLSGAHHAKSPITAAFDPSDILLNSNNAEKSTLSTELNKIKEVAVYGYGNLRIAFDIHGTGDKNAEGRIYKNDELIGTLQVTSSTTYVTFSEDLGLWEWGDLCQLYFRTADSLKAAYIKNFRIYADLAPYSFTNVME